MKQPPDHDGLSLNKPHRSSRSDQAWTKLCWCLYDFLNNNRTWLLLLTQATDYTMLRLSSKQCFLCSDSYHDLLPRSWVDSMRSSLCAYLARLMSIPASTIVPILDPDIKCSQTQLLLATSSRSRRNKRDKRCLSLRVRLIGDKWKLHSHVSSQWDVVSNSTRSMLDWCFLV